MKKILFVLSMVFIGNAYAIDFRTACERVNAQKSGSSGKVCRYVGKNYNYSIHQEKNNELFALMYIDDQIVSDEVLSKMQLLAKTMEVEIIDDFYQTIKRTNPGDRVGLSYGKKNIVWRHGTKDRGMSYSGFAIMPNNDTAPSGTLRCRATTCPNENRYTKWYGPTMDPQTRKVKNASEEALQGDAGN